MYIANAGLMFNTGPTCPPVMTNPDVYLDQSLQVKPVIFLNVYACISDIGHAINNVNVR